MNYDRMPHRNASCGGCLTSSRPPGELHKRRPSGFSGSGCQSADFSRALFLPIVKAQLKVGTSTPRGSDTMGHLGG